MDGLTLGFVARELLEKLIPGRVDRVLQPERDELHLIVRASGGTHRLLLSASADGARAHLTSVAKQNPQEPPMFCMLMRKRLVGARVLSVRQIASDRVLEIDFEATDELGERGRCTLSCEIMGKHSNLILRGEDGRIVDSIRHVGADMSRVREVRPGLPYMPPPSQGKLDWEHAEPAALAAALKLPRLDKALADALCGLSAQSARELAFRLTGDAESYVDAQTVAAPLRALLDALPTFAPPVLLVDDDGEPVRVFPFPQAHLPASMQKEVPEGVSAALDLFYAGRDRHVRMAQKTAALTRSLKSHIERCEKKLALHREALESDAAIEAARVCGELLTANLHAVKRGLARVTVPDYYAGDGSTREIALDIRLTPAQNAQKYYRQYQRLQEARKHASQQIEVAARELSLLEGWLDDLRKCEAAEDLDELRAEMVREGFLRSSHARGKPRKPAPSKPLSFVSSDNIEILVGKNGAQNDRLTQAAPQDATWLHAKNMPGSHVLIKTSPVPERTLLEAAMLAAYYSKGNGSAQVPVDYTLRRHVKKPSGAPAGMAIYTHQKTLYVTPDEGAVKRLIERAQKA